MLKLIYDKLCIYLLYNHDDSKASMRDSMCVLDARVQNSYRVELWRWYKDKSRVNGKWKQKYNDM